MTDIETRIRAILHELSAVPPEKIRVEDRLREDLNLDSVSSMELIGMLSEELDIDVELEEAMEIEDVAGIIAMVDKYLGATT
jgi:acyl carrier protein